MTTDYLHKLSLRAEHSVGSWNTTELPPWVDPSDPPPGPPGPPYPPWPPEAFCVDFVPRLKIHAASVINPDSCVGLLASGGVPPYTFSIVVQSEGHYWIEGDQVCADEDACGYVTVRVTDVCLNTADHDLISPIGQWLDKTYGCSPIHSIVHPYPDIIDPDWLDYVNYAGTQLHPGEQFLDSIWCYSTYGKYKQLQLSTLYSCYACLIPDGQDETPTCNCPYQFAISVPVIRNAFNCGDDQSVFECVCEKSNTFNGGYCTECISDNYRIGDYRVGVPFEYGDEYGVCFWHPDPGGMYFRWGVPRQAQLYYWIWGC